MMPVDEFYSHKIGIDPYGSVVPNIKLDDIPEKDTSLPIHLSVMMSTCIRYSQLQRSLECLCRQTWKEFEVLICDDGDPRDLTPIFYQFEPYLRLRMIRKEKTHFSVDPTGGFIKLFPCALGEYWAIMQPECMLWPTACEFLYQSHKEELPDVYYNPRIDPSGRGNISYSEINGRTTWAVLPVYWLNHDMQIAIDSVDWHSNMDNITSLPLFWSGGGGLSNKSNAEWHHEHWNGNPMEFPWWFVASAHRDAGIWKAMIELFGHAMIDFFTLGYRRMHDYVDIVPKRPLAVHQDHIRMSFGVEGEQEQLTKSLENSSDV